MNRSWFSNNFPRQDSGSSPSCQLSSMVSCTVHMVSALPFFSRCVWVEKNYDLIVIHLLESSGWIVHPWEVLLLCPLAAARSVCVGVLFTLVLVHSRASLHARRSHDFARNPEQDCPGYFDEQISASLSRVSASCFIHIMGNVLDSCAIVCSMTLHLNI